MRLTCKGNRNRYLISNIETIALLCMITLIFLTYLSLLEIYLFPNKQSDPCFGNQGIRQWRILILVILIINLGGNSQVRRENLLANIKPSDSCSKNALLLKYVGSERWYKSPWQEIAWSCHSVKTRCLTTISPPQNCLKNKINKEIVNSLVPPR